MKTDKNKNEFGLALDELMQVLQLRYLSELWRLTDIYSNKSRWEKMRYENTKDRATSNDINVFIRNLEKGLKDKRYKDIEKGHELDDSCYILTSEQKNSLYKAAGYNREETSESDRIRKLKREIGVDSQRLRETRLARFVPDTRQEETSEISERIKSMRSSGGYLVVTGVAGSGKSTVIARLIKSDLQLYESASHFVSFDPREIEPKILMRSLMALLTLKHPYLSAKWMDEDYTLEVNFDQMLREISEHGHKEIIFIDGLDQLKHNVGGERNLDFLPNTLPEGIVIVLGTRPDDTLKQLKIHLGYKELPLYELRELSKDDFCRLLKHYKAPLNDRQELVDYFYEKLGKNALYLDLLAQELTKPDAMKVEDIVEDVIKRIEDDPDNIYTISINRLKKRQWDKIIYPVLGLLLVARQPLGLLSMADILNVPAESLHDGLQQLMGLLTENSDRQYALYHLKLFDYLRYDEKKPDKNWVFTIEDEQDYHKLLANWCEGRGRKSILDIWQDEGKAIPTQNVRERREYARQHYIKHLYESKDWECLWSALDDGRYGQAKILYEGSAKSYIEDLQLGREAAQHEKSDLEIGVKNLPRLWKYSLLRLLLIGQADRYPVEAFQAMVLLGRDNEAIGLSELLNDKEKKVNALIQIALCLRKRNPHTNVRGFLLQARNLALLFDPSKKKAQLLCKVASALIDIEEKSIARKLLKNAYEEAQSIKLEDVRSWIQCELAVSLYRTLDKVLAVQWIKGANTLAASIIGVKEKSNAQANIASTYARMGFINQAIQLLQSPEANTKRKRSISGLHEEVEIARRCIVEAMIEAGKLDDAVQFAQSWKSSWQKADALKAIARALEVTDERGQALLLLKEAVEVVYKVEDDSWDMMTPVLMAMTKKIDDEELYQYTRYGSALCDLARELHAIGERELLAGLLSKALKNAEQVASAEAMANVARTYIKLGEMQEATQVIAQIKQLINSKSHSQRDVERSIRALSIITLELIRIEEQEQARRLFQEMRDLVRIDQVYSMQLSDTINMHQMQDWAWMMAAKANAIAEKWDEAETALYQMSSTGIVSRSGALKTAVAQLGAIGQSERALSLIHSLKAVNDSDRMSALCELAKALAKHGSKSESLLILREAEDTIRSYQEISWYKEQDDLIEVIRSCATVSEWERVEGLAYFAKERHNVAGICEAATILAKGGLRTRALRLLVEAKKIYRPTDCLGDEDALAKAFIALNLWERAIEYILSDNCIHTSTMAEIITTLIKVGHREEAEQIIRHSSDEEEEELEVIEELAQEKLEELCVAKAIALAEINEFDEALIIAKSLQVYNLKVEALGKLATNLFRVDKVKAKDLLEEAEQIIISGESLNPRNGDIEYRNEALENLSIAYAQTGDWPKAEKIARSIKDRISGPHSLYQLAYAMVNKGAKKVALQMVQRLYMEAPTSEMLVLYLVVGESLMSIQPEVVLEFPRSVKSIENFLTGI